MFSKNTYDQFQRTWAAIAVGAVSIGVGVAEKSAANHAQEKALSKVKPYQTPQAVYDVLKATQFNAQSGFDGQTLNYLTNQTNNAFASSLGVAQRLGGDPNALSAIFGQQVDAIQGIGAQNHQLQMQNFSAYINALGVVGANDAAEQKSKQDQLKDQLQKISQDKADSTQQIAQGINTAISGYSNYQIGKLYANNGNTNTYIPQTTNSTGYVAPLASEVYRAQGMTIK